MLKIERHIRAIGIMERIQQLCGELIVLQDEARQGGERNRLHAAQLHLTHASDALQDIPTHEADIAVMLRLSIEDVKEKKALCQVVSFPGNGAS